MVDAPDRPRKRPRQQRSRFTVDVLLEGAAQVFEKRGPAATTNDIARRAGVSIGTLYQYFPNKHAILFALAGRHLAEGEQRLRSVGAELRSEQPPFEETMRRMLDVVVELHSDRPALHALLHRVTPRSAVEIAAIEGLEELMVAEVAWHLVRCRRGGPDPEFTARTIVHAVDVQVHRVLARHGMQVEPLLAMVSSLVPEPAGSAPGR